MRALRQNLVNRAIQARERAYAPYSGFKVGAAALFEDDRIYTGCNVENASFGATRCAEQVAILTGVAEGCRRLETIAVVCESDAPLTLRAGRPDPVRDPASDRDSARSGPPVWPCGVCRQIICEFGPEATVIAATVDGAVEEASIQELLPRPFGREALQ